MNVPYDELDEPVRELVKVLNSLPGVATIGSCGGHADGDPGGVHAAGGGDPNARVLTRPGPAQLRAARGISGGTRSSS